MNTKSICLFIALCFAIFANAQKTKTFILSSPDGTIKCTVNAGVQLTWSVTSGDQTILSPSVTALHLQGNEVLGGNAVITSSKTTHINKIIAAIFYKKDTVANDCNELTLMCKGNYGVAFRAYNDGVAYRFFVNRKDSVVVQSEDANFAFDKDYNSFLPYANDPRDGKDFFQTSFEALYQERKLSQQLPNDSIAFLPVLIDLDNGKKAVITEAGLENYPGMYMSKDASNAQSLKGRFAPYPTAFASGGYHNINYVVTKRENYIAKTKGTATFPWRVLIVSNSDKELANNDMMYRLAEPLRLTDVSWIKPGKVAWDWWSDWNISHVDFKAGINTETYKYYIDFAAANKLEYIIIDEGWSSDSDLMKASSALDLKAVVDYGKGKGVGVILWSTWYAAMKGLDNAFSYYSEMGVRGFKIDFLDRDDEVMTNSTYLIAAKAAQHHLLVDFHGMYKPDGLSHTYPNIINFEGVRGMENVKWSPYDNVPRYDVTIPFIRMLAGPMDYTPGAMRNATKATFHPAGSLPMSQGTRCHQMAMYTVFEAPLQMLSDNPTAYQKEQESTDFIAKVPTTFNETVALDGKVGEYVSIARRKGDTWFIGAMNNWNARDITVDLSFLPTGNYEAVVFQDGVNADRDATDYKTITRQIKAGDKITVHMAPGGGWTARIYPAK